MNNILSDEDFASAAGVTKQQFRDVDAVQKAVIRRFKDRCPLYDFVLVPRGENVFAAYVFYERNADVEACQRSGISGQIVDFVHKELEAVGRTKREPVKVVFAFDSDENVAANFDGDYFLRVR